MSGSRKQLRAVLLSFVMVTSMVAIGGAAFAGTAAATTTNGNLTSSTPVSSGSTIDLTASVGSGDNGAPVQAFVDSNNNDQFDLGEQTAEIQGNRLLLTVDGDASTGSVSAGEFMSIGGSLIVTSDNPGTSSPMSDFVIAGSPGTTFSDDTNLETAGSFSLTSSTDTGVDIDTGSTPGQFPASTNTITLTAGSSLPQSIDKGDALVLNDGQSTIDGSSVRLIAAEGVSSSGVVELEVAGQAGKSLSSQTSIHEVSPGAGSNYGDGPAKVDGQQTINQVSTTQDGQITIPSSASGTTKIGLRQTSSLSNGDAAEAATSTFEVTSSLSGGSNGQVSYDINSGSSTQKLVFGQTNQTVSLLRFQDNTENSAFSGTVTLKLPKGVTVNESASQLNPGKVTGTGDLSGEVNSVSVSSDNREVDVSLGTSSSAGDRIRFSNALAVDVDPTQFNTKGSSNTDLGNVKLEYALGTLDIGAGGSQPNSPLFEAPQLDPSVPGDSISVNTDRQALSADSAIQVDHVDQGAIGDSTAIQVTLDNGVTFDGRSATDAINLDEEDIDSDGTAELNVSNSSINAAGDTLTIPVIDSVDSDGSTIDIDTGVTNTEVTTDGNADNSFSSGDILRDTGDNDLVIAGEDSSTISSEAALTVIGDDGTSFGTDDLETVSRDSDQSTGASVASGSTTSFSGTNIITLTADSDISSSGITAGDVVGLAGDDSSITDGDNTFTIAAEDANGDELAIVAPKGTSFSTGEEIRFIDNSDLSTGSKASDIASGTTIDVTPPARFNTTGSATPPNINITVEATAASTGPFQISDSSGSATLSSALTVDSPQVDLNPSNGDVNVLAGADARLVQDSGKNVQIDLTSASVPSNQFINITANNSAVTFDAIDISGDGSGLTYGSNVGPGDINNVSVSSDGSTLAIGVGGSAIGGTAGDTIDVPISADDVNNVDVTHATGGSSSAGEPAAISGNFVIAESGFGSSSTTVAGVGGDELSSGDNINDVTFSGSDTNVDLASSRQGGSSSGSNHFVLNADGDLPTSISEGDVLAVSSDTGVSEDTDTMAIALEDVGSSQSTIRVAADQTASFTSGNNILTAGASAGSQYGSTASVSSTVFVPNAVGLSVGSSVADETNVQLNLTVGPVENSDTNDVLVLDKPNTAFNKDGGSAANKTLSVDNDGLQNVEIGDNTDDDGALNIDFDDVDGHGEAGTFVNVTLESDTGVTFDTREDSSATTDGSSGDGDVDVTDAGSILDTSNNITINEKNIGIGINGDISSGDSIDIDELFVNATSDATNTTVSVTTNNGDNRVTTEVEEIITTQTATPGNVFGDADVTEDDDQGTQTVPGASNANFGPTSDDAAQDGTGPGSPGSETATTTGGTAFGSVFVKNGGSAFGDAAVNLSIVQTPDGASGAQLNTTSATTDSDGTVDFEFVAGDTVGQYIVNASTSAGGVNITYAVTSGQASQLNVTNVDNALRDSGPTTTEDEVAALKVRIEDSGGNIAPTDTDVTINIDASDAQLATGSTASGLADEISGGSPAGNDVTDSEPDGRFNYDSSADGGTKGVFFVFVKSGTAEDVTVSVTPEVAGTGVNAISGDSATTTVFERIDSVNVSFNTSSPAVGDSVRADAVAQTSDGTNIEVPRLSTSSFSLGNQTVATIDDEESQTGDDGVYSANLTANAVGSTAVNAAIKGTDGSSNITVEEAGTGSPLDGPAGRFDNNGDGDITVSELGDAGTAFAQGELTVSELGEVGEAFAS